MARNRMVCVVLILCSSEVLGARDEQVDPGHESHKQVCVSQMMHIWSVINVVRSIARKDAAALNERLCEEQVKLYAYVYHLGKMGMVTPHDLPLLEQLFSSVEAAHEDLCRVQDPSESRYVKCLMRLLRTEWNTIAEGHELVEI